MGSHRLYALGTDIGGKLWAEPVPSVPHRPVADFDPARVRSVFDISKRQREPDVEHHWQANDLGARLEIAKGAVSGPCKS